MNEILLEGAGAYFDSSTFLSKATALSGIAAANAGTFAARVKFTEDLNAYRFLFHILDGIGGNTHFVIRRSDNAAGTKFNIFASLLGVTEVNQSTTNAWTFSDGWLNLLFSWDVRNDTQAQMYINDTDDAAAPATWTNLNLAYDGAAVRVGRQVNDPANAFVGNVQFLWFDPTAKMNFRLKRTDESFSMPAEKLLIWVQMALYRLAMHRRFISLAITQHLKPILAPVAVLPKTVHFKPQFNSGE